jgi:hypothetical protein
MNALHAQVLTTLQRVLYLTEQGSCSINPAHKRHSGHATHAHIVLVPRSYDTAKQARTRSLIFWTYCPSSASICGRSMYMCVVSRITGFVPLTLHRASLSSVGSSSRPQLSHWSPRASW